MMSRGKCRPEKMPMALIISRRSFYCPNFATAPIEETLGVSPLNATIYNPHPRHVMKTREPTGGEDRGVSPG